MLPPVQVASLAGVPDAANLPTNPRRPRRRRRRRQSSAAGGGADEAAASAAKARKKRARTERQARLFADLDEAESTVLEMIALAGETASSLSDLASGAKKGDDDEGKSVADRIAEAAKKNGEDYLQKVARVHSLLMPHADKVVAYRNHEVDTGGGVGPEQEATKPTPAVCLCCWNRNRR